MRRGEVWWTRADSEFPVVLLSGAEPAGVRAVHIVAPATEAQKRGFVILSPEAAANAENRERAGAAADAVGIEVPLGAAEGLDRPGVVRLGLPQDGRVFCTWLLTVSGDDLLEKAGTLSAAKLRQLGGALALTGSA